MKRFVTLLSIPLILFACGGPEKYDISGNVENMNKVPVKLQKTQDGEWVTHDSARVEYGEFSFRGKLEHPQMMRLQFGEDLGGVQFFAENSNIRVVGTKDSLNALEVEGSETHNQYEQFQGKLGSYDQELQKAYASYRKAREQEDDAGMKEAQDQYQALSENKRAFIKEYVHDHPQSVLAPYITRRHLLSFMEYGALDSLYTSLAPAVKETKYAEALKERKDVLERTQVGKPFIDFTLPDTTGNPVSLSEYVGEGYVLLDFWAAWCTPCRKENPHLVDAYQKYHEKGFEIFGVSFDRKKEAWVQAIHKDNITWPQVSDLNYWDSKAGRMYGVRSIPANFLINKEGKIVAKNLRGEELKEKLSEIYREES
jgi:peroxiredoxin